MLTLSPPNPTGRAALWPALQFPAQVKAVKGTSRSLALLSPVPFSQPNSPPACLPMSLPRPRPWR